METATKLRNFNDFKNDIKDYVDSVDTEFLFDFLQEKPIWRGEPDFEYISGSHGLGLEEDNYDFYFEDLTDEQKKELVDFIEQIYEEADERLEKLVPDWHIREDYVSSDGGNIFSYRPDTDFIKENMIEVFSYNNFGPNCLDASDYNYIYGSVFFYEEEETFFHLRNSYQAVEGWNHSSRQDKFEEIGTEAAQEIINNFNCEIEDEEIFEEYFAEEENQ